MRKIYLRLLPFAVLSYILAYIDRINVSLAGLTMRGDLDMSATAFIIGILTLAAMTDRPEQPKLLTAEEKAWLPARVRADGGRARSA